MEFYSLARERQWAREYKDYNRGLYICIYHMCIHIYIYVSDMCIYIYMYFSMWWGPLSCKPVGLWTQHA